LYKENNKLREAIACLKTIEEKDKDNIDVINQLGNIYLKRKNY